ncbi:Synaptobrevin [Ancylostoma caninum]|uniref:Synaptobrevin n=2 Tax=Ancylostoma TaxID=29169 RepID=A0A368FTP4_ANCCA|nr:Synaptobrevin [Ancylostoma caninum]
MAENSQRPNQDVRISDMRRHVDEVKNVMAANVASIMERGERLDSIERRTDELQASNSQRPNQDVRISDMRRQVDEVKNVMAANVASIMERGERLDSIERRTDELQASSANFKMTAHRVQRKMCMMNAKWTVISVLFGIVVAAVVILLILHACGVFDKK